MEKVPTHPPVSDACRHPSGIDPRVDPAAWVRNNERITNEADVEGWLALYAPDAVLETITDGAYDRRDGLAEITPAVEVLAAVCRKHTLVVSKRFVCASEDVVVNAWSGGFEGRARQRGTEIWTLRGPQVVRHEMYTFLDVRPRTTLRARARALFGGELGVLRTAAREEARHGLRPGKSRV